MNNLNPKWKTDYFTQILKYDDKVNERIADEHAKVLQEHIKTLGEKDQLNNVKEIWTNGVEVFNNLMESKINTQHLSAS